MFAEMDHADEDPMTNITTEHQRLSEKPLIFERSGTQYVAMVTNLFGSFCRTHLAKSYYEESNISDTNWQLYLFSSYFHHIFSSYFVITWLICIFSKLEYLWKEKRYLKIDYRLLV